MSHYFLIPSWKNVLGISLCFSPFFSGCWGLQWDDDIIAFSVWTHAKYIKNSLIPSSKANVFGGNQAWIGRQVILGRYSTRIKIFPMGFFIAYVLFSESLQGQTSEISRYLMMQLWVWEWIIQGSPFCSGRFLRISWNFNQCRFGVFLNFVVFWGGFAPKSLDSLVPSNVLKCNISHAYFCVFGHSLLWNLHPRNLGVDFQKDKEYFIHVNAQTIIWLGGEFYFIYFFSLNALLRSLVGSRRMKGWSQPCYIKYNVLYSFSSPNRDTEMETGI